MLFPVIAWYDIIGVPLYAEKGMLLFPVIAWYDIITYHYQAYIRQLLFPVIAWYDIIFYCEHPNHECCCSRLSLGMI